MNVVLWILQIGLCVKVLSAAYTHGLRRDETKMQKARQRFGGAARPLLAFVALCAFVGGLGLVLPAATGILTWLTPLAAGLLAVMMLLGVGFHAACAETRNVVVSLVLFAVTAFVSYGRRVIAPF